MISSIQELNKVKDEYYKWVCHRSQDCQERADKVAADNFSWVLDTAIQLAESKENEQ